MGNEARQGRVIERCQACGAGGLQRILDLGRLPLVNDFPDAAAPLADEPRFPAEWLHCPACDLVQLGYAVDRRLVFPPGYPYTSGATAIKRDNFQGLYDACMDLVAPAPSDLIVDIGSNDGSLLEVFQRHGHRVLGVEPTDVADLAAQRRVPTRKVFFDGGVADEIRAEHGAARVLAATNLLAHVDNVSEVLDGCLALLAEDGVLVAEIQYLFGVIDDLSIDSIYHEHLRYYSLHTLAHHLGLHGLEVFHAAYIPTHGASLRLFAARPGTFAPDPSVAAIGADERSRGSVAGQLLAFGARAEKARDDLRTLLAGVRAEGERVVGIGAAPRAAALMNFAGIDEGTIEGVLEPPGSLKIGKRIPGTRVPVLDESVLLGEQPAAALFLAWHIADELAPKLWQRGYRGDFIVPLPEPRILRFPGEGGSRG